MTSKISSVNLLKESIKRNLAFAVLLMLVYFCYFPVGGLLVLNNISYTGGMNDRWTWELAMFGSRNVLLLAVTISVAVLMGILQFSYSHSQRKTDFYHSLPIKREKLFLIQYAAGILIWLVPYAVNSLIFWFLCTVRGVDGVGVQMMKGFVIHIVCYLLAYSCMIFSMMLTGKIFVAVTGVLVISGYAPGMYALIDSLMITHFSTFTGLPEEPVSVKLTPVWAFLCSGKYLLSDSAVFPVRMTLAALLTALLITIVCICLYRRRRSEAAGNAMAFESAARAIKFLIVVPGALVCYLFLRLASNDSILWGIFGLLMGLLIFSALVEFIYCMDIREVFKDKWQLLFTGAICLAIAAEFCFDLTGFDQWIPKEAEVESAEISMEGIPLDGFRYLEDASHFSRMVHKDDIQIGEENMENLLELVKYSGEMAGFEDTADENGGVYNWRGSTYYTDEEQVIYRCRLEVTWHLRNGKTKKRGYTISRKIWEEYFEEIWEDPEIQEECYPFLKAEEEDILEIRTGSHLYNTVYYNMGQWKECADNTAEMAYTGDKGEFLAALKEDFRNVTVSFYDKAGEEEDMDVQIIYRDQDQKVYWEYLTITDDFPKIKALLMKSAEK